MSIEIYSKLKKQETKIMKKQNLYVTKEENTNIIFFERNKNNFVKRNEIVKLTYSDGSIRYTAKYASDNRVAGSQSPYDYNVVRFIANGYFHNGIYKNTYKKSGDGLSRGYGIHGLYGVRGGGYVYVIDDGKVYRQTYNLKMTAGRDVVYELVCTYNYLNQPIMEVIEEQVEEQTLDAYVYGDVQSFGEEAEEQVENNSEDKTEE